MTELDKVCDALARARRVLVTAHRGPDGDSVGSMVALVSLLRAANKEVTLYNPDLVPRNLKWLPHTRGLVHKLRKAARFDVTVVVDTGDPALLGDEFPPAEVTGAVVVLDHHASARPFGDVFYSDPEAACVGVMVRRVARQLGWAITPEVAAGLFVSLVSDTGSFRYSNANAEAFALAEELVGAGLVNPWHINERMHERVPLSRYRLLAAALGTLELACDGKVAFISITHEMVKAANGSWDDSEGVVNYARAIDGVECGVLLTPAKGGGTRVSLRSKGHLIDAGKVCLALGGGGHPGAAGCRLPGELADARATIEQALTAALAAAVAD